jgi:hypothetical protein
VYNLGRRRRFYGLSNSFFFFLFIFLFLFHFLVGRVSALLEASK